MSKESRSPALTHPDQADRDRLTARSGDLEVRLAASEAELEAAQRLRYRIFYDEMNAMPSPAIARDRRDFDRFDEAADHLLVLDTSQPTVDRAIVGTYRLIRRTAIARCGGFYTSGEFDIGRLNAWPGEVLELGRSCVDADYRNRRAINLLWRGIAIYLKRHNIQLMFGCGSLPGTDHDTLRLPLSYLYHYHLAPRHIRPRALEERYLQMDLMPKDAVDPKQALEMIPPLIKGYLRLGGFVGDGAVLDPQFGCIDVCVVVLTEMMTEKYARHYGYESRSLNAA